MMHSSTIAGSMPARRTASATTSAPSCGAVKLFSAPKNLPVGVRTADTTTDSRTTNLDAVDDGRTEEGLQPSQDDARRTPDLARPQCAGGVDQQDASDELHRRDAPERGTD